MLHRCIQGTREVPELTLGLTPETTSKGLDCAPPNTTDWVLLDNYVSTLQGMDLLGDGIIYAEVIDVGLSRRLCKDRKTG